jgi:hypothetical protein
MAMRQNPKRLQPIRATASAQARKIRTNPQAQLNYQQQAMLGKGAINRYLNNFKNFTTKPAAPLDRQNKNRRRQATRILSAPVWGIPGV